MELKIKAVSPKMGREIPLPRYQTAGAAAMDLCACVDKAVTLAPGQRRGIPTGIAIALPSPDYVALVNLSQDSYTIQPGDRIAQLMVTPVVRPVLVQAEELDETDRGAGGFGSTGR